MFSKISFFAVAVAAVAMAASINGAAIDSRDNSQTVCSCTREFLPICGSDDETYSNQCTFGCAKKANSKLEIKFYGICGDQAHILPIDDDDIRILPIDENEFNFLAMNDDDAHILPIDDQCDFCTLEYAPVCATNEETYANECVFNCERRKNRNLKIKFHGACNEDVCDCTEEYWPVCGSDGITYPNECTLGCKKHTQRNLRMVHEGECTEEDLEPVPLSQKCFCTREYAPICGTDDQTYQNDCQFECKRKENAKLRMKFRGECADEVNILPIADVCICTDEFNPVCGSDRQTYSSECRFGCEQNKQKSLRIAHPGQCESVQDECFCTREYAPICATDDQTYSNECHFNCERRKNENLKVKSVGECKYHILPIEEEERVSILPIADPKNNALTAEDTVSILPIDDNEVSILPIGNGCLCVRVVDPVCGTDDATYRNLCALNCQARTPEGEKINLRLKYHGECRH